MYVHERLRLVYLAHPRTASQAMSAALTSIGFVSALDLRRRHNRNPPPLEASVGPDWHHRRLARHPGPGWTVFTTVRNHFDAWASWWCFVTESPFRDDPAGAELVDRVTAEFPRYFPNPGRMWGMHTTFADHVLRYERQEAALDVMLGIRVTLPRENVSATRAGRHYRDMIGPELRESIETRYGGEIDRLGYSW